MVISFEWNGYYLWDKVLNDLLKFKHEQDINMMEPYRHMRKRVRFRTSHAPNEYNIHSIPYSIPLATRVVSLIFAWNDLPKEGLVYINARSYDDYRKFIK